MIRFSLVPLLVCVCAAASMVWAAGSGAGKAAGKASAKGKPSLRKAHPRLMLTDQRLAELKKLAETDKDLQRMVGEVIRRADGYGRAKPLVYHKVGPRLLSVSRACLDRIYALGVAWRWTDKTRYAEKIRDNLLTVCAFKDWNPSHFLDTAEMAHAVGVGYDWTYNWLTETDRTTIRRGLVKLGLTPGMNAYTGKARYGWWRTCSHNWNQVCNGGLIAAALAVAEDEKDLAGKILTYARASLPRALATYGPDGAWPEGPGYWHYATRYTAYGLCALETALGTDGGLGQAKGLDKTGLFPIHLCGPIDRFFAFADTGSSRRAMPCQFYLAGRYDLPLVAWSEHALAERYGAKAEHVVWYVPRPKRPPAKAATAARFRGEVEVAVFRSAWGNRNALFAGIKAGTNRANHAHLDLGDFQVDALGVRWAEDLGGDNYNLPGYWDTKQGGRRWKYYRLGSLSHNVPQLDGALQDARAAARMMKFQGDGAAPYAIVDLTAAYKPTAKRVGRGLKLIAGRRAVLIQDQFELAKTCEVAWGMTTKATIAPDGARAELTLDGKRMRATLLAPASGAFTVESAEQKPPQRSNRGYRRLMVRLPKQTGRVSVAVLLAPVWPDGKKVAPPKLVPLSTW